MPLAGVPGAKFISHKGPVIIRLALHGHKNRPFFHIVLTNKFLDRDDQPVEQLGTYDPMPNSQNQKLVSLNIERTRFWMGQGAEFSHGLSQLLGLVGFLPIHPTTVKKAWRARHLKSQAEENQDKEK